MAETLDLSVFVKRTGELAHMELAVEGVGCAGCIRMTTGLTKHTERLIAAIDEVLQETA